MRIVDSQRLAILASATVGTEAILYNMHERKHVLFSQSWTHDLYADWCACVMLSCRHGAGWCGARARLVCYGCDRNRPSSVVEHIGNSRVAVVSKLAWQHCCRRCHRKDDAINGVAGDSLVSSRSQIRRI